MLVGLKSAHVELRNIRVSPRKLNLVAQTIRGIKVDKAMNALKFSHRKQKILNFTLRKKKKKYEIFNIEETSATAVGKKKLKKKKNTKKVVYT